MRNRISKKQGRHRKGIGRDQLCNVRLEQQIREVEAELKKRGIDLRDVKPRAVRSACVPECTYLRTREHAPGCITEEPAVRPSMFEDVPAAMFPFRMQVVDAETDELLWETVVTGPGTVDVPGFYPRKVAALIIDKHGTVTREEP